jgi:type II secretion system protein H
MTPHRGFTLIEILIVLVILAVAAGMVTLNLTRDDRGSLVRAARDLSGDIEYAADRARYRHELLGLAELPDGKGWQFLVISTDGGKAVTSVPRDDPNLAPTTLPDGMTYRSVSYAGAPTEKGTILPILPSGRFEPFTVELKLEDWSIQVSIDPLGRVAMGEAERNE